MNNFFDEELVDQRGTITFEKRRKFREGVENFIDGKLNPGYIKSYLPGVRENGRTIYACKCMGYYSRSYA